MGGGGEGRGAPSRVCPSASAWAGGCVSEWQREAFLRKPTLQVSPGQRERRAAV